MSYFQAHVMESERMQAGVISGTTQLLGVIGYPIKHSLSPVMHNAAIATLALDYVYLPFAIAPPDLAAALRGFAAMNVRGFNITIPHKQSVFPLLSEISDVARAVGAVNTVWPGDSGWYGTNTDILGFLAPLQALERNWSNTPALILGNGGAARAVVAACQQLGCPEIWVFGRNAATLTAFLHSWQGAPLTVDGGKASPPPLSVFSWETLDQHLPMAGLVVNSTPVGMAPDTDPSPLSLAQMAQLPDDAIVYDLIYTPRPTTLLKQAKQLGLTPVDGLEMLVQQGAAAFEIWLQQKPPVTVMRQALLHQLAPNPLR